MAGSFSLILSLISVFFVRNLLAHSEAVVGLSVDSLNRVLISGSRDMSLKVGVFIFYFFSSVVTSGHRDDQWSY